MARTDACPSKDPLTGIACMLRDDRLDHGDVGHLAHGPMGRIGWLPSENDKARWAAHENARAAGPHLIAGFTAPSAGDLLEYRPRLRDQIAHEQRTGVLAHFTVHRDGRVSDRDGNTVIPADQEPSL